jgi:hypothetical protein
MTFTGLNYQGETPLDYQNILKKNEGQEVKQVFSRDEYQCEVVGIRKG